MTWIPLNVHSQYSILDSTASVTALAEKAKQYNIPALAITDQGNLYGAVDFYKACKATGVKPILGCKIWMAPASRLDKKRIPGVPNGSSLILLAKDAAGYRNLCKLSSIGFLEGFYYQPRIDRELLQTHREGLVCLSGSVSGRLGHFILQQKEEELLREIEWFHSLFGDDFYFELQRHPMSEETIRQDGMDKEGWVLQKLRDHLSAQKMVNEKFIELSKQMQIRCVATNDIHYLEREDWRAHEILLNVQSGEPCEIWERDSRGNPKNKAPNPKRDTYPTHELYFKSPDEMKALFADVPEAIEETLRIAEKCKCELDFKSKHYPIFIAPDLAGKKFTKEERLKAAEEFLHKLCEEGIQKRYTPERLAAITRVIPEKDPLTVVKERFAYEFHIIVSKGMTDYMLIVYDFIAWAKSKKIPMGPGRGSAAGSIIAYLIGITDIEPLRFHLFFERFINPERVSYPDIDVDICMERRQEVIDYVVEKYGKDKVAQIITFGTMKAKMAIKDVGRVLNVPLAKVNEIAALVPEDPTMTLEKAFQIDPELNRRMESDEETRQVLEMAKKAEGSIRNTSTHAAGMIISGSPITDHIPVCTAKDSSMVVTQFAMKPVESVGMLKIDFLGLKTLTSIQTCVNLIGDPSIDWVNLPLDNKAAFDLLNQGRTLGVFQLESGGMQDLAKQLHIDVFEEIIAVGALYRPGPMDMIPSFCNRKHGREEIEIDHPLMKDILAETYGVMVYQEQVMQIASALAGYTLGEGDVLRRAMGKKDKEEMARQREKFLSGCAKKEIDSGIAARIFEKIERFASYGFNKSHAAAYAYLTYVTAYFKASYPSQWMAALMTCDRDDTTKLAKFIREARSMHIEMLPPDVNQAGSEFIATTPEITQNLGFGLRESVQKSTTAGFASGGVLEQYAPTCDRRFLGTLTQPKAQILSDFGYKEGIRFAMSGIKGVGGAVVEEILHERKRKGSFSSLYDFIERVDKNKIGKKSIELLIDAGSFDFTGWSRDAMRLSVDAMYADASRSQKEKSLGVLDLFATLSEEKTDPFQAPPSVPQPSTNMQLWQKEKELLGFYLTGHPMDLYRDILRRLSCVPLREFEVLPDASVVRAAFIVETAEVKISNKSQRKFAILTISDGFERFELPVWSEMYEEKGALLRENQLLYGVLTLERKNGTLNLAAKFLEDLSTIDEAKIKACDECYDRLKATAKSEPKWKAKEKPTTAPAEKEEITLVKLRVDADRIRLSEILALKKLFREYPGKSPIELQFYTETKKLATIHVESSWGVKVDRDFRDALQALSQKIGLQIS